MKQKYFAAANTYQGFKSYFDQVFNPIEYEKIYVIKGGPGTGKSTLMKTVSEHFEKAGCCVEEIYCSSDPSSLDGLICENSGKKIAILDGTAPHVVDAKFPGVIEKIINLGAHLDERWLRAQRDEILALAREKSSAYSAAYSYMKIAGEAHRFMHDTICKNIDFCKAEKAIFEFCHDFYCENKVLFKTRLVSSFGKSGKLKLDTLDKLDCKRIGITGNETEAGAILSYFSSKLSREKIPHTFFPSALSPDLTDAILLNEGTLMLVLGEGDENIRSSDFPTEKTCGYNSERIKSVTYLHDISLGEAERWFKIASDLHFRLEEIYSAAMSFDKNEAITQEIVSEMANILEV